MRFYLSQLLSHLECYEPQRFELSAEPEFFLDVGDDRADDF